MSLGPTQPVLAGKGQSVPLCPFPAPPFVNVVDVSSHVLLQFTRRVNALRLAQAAMKTICSGVGAGLVVTGATLLVPWGERRRRRRGQSGRERQEGGEPDSGGARSLGGRIRDRVRAMVQKRGRRGRGSEVRLA